MKKYIEILTRSLKPYAGIIYFGIVLFSADFFWKWVVDANINSQSFAAFGVDYTSQFYAFSQWTARQIYHFSCLFPGTDFLYLYDTRLYFWDSGMRLNIIWGCTGAKQFYVFLAIMLFYPGPWKKKLWYLPLGALILWAYNIVRISSILFMTRNHPEWFDFLHDKLFRYAYYGLIFLIWVYWEEKIRKPVRSK